MRLHGNAALSWQGRRRLARRVVVEGWTLSRIEGGAGKRWRDKPKQHYNPTRTDAAGVRRQTVGWEYAVDDHSRLAYAEVLSDEKASTAAAFLRRALAYYRRHGIAVERILIDNGSCYGAAIHALACRRLGIKHSRTRPYRPQTNGCESGGRFRLGPLPGSRRCCLCVTRPNGWLVSMPLL